VGGSFPIDPTKTDDFVANAPLRVSGQQVARSAPHRRSGPTGGRRSAAPLPTKRRGKWARRLQSPRVPWIIATTVVLALAAALEWQRVQTSRPTYALAQIELAVRQHDATKLAYYVDAGALTSEIVGGTVDWLAAHHRLDDVVDGEAEQGSKGRAVRLQTAKVILGDRANRAATGTLAIPLDEAGPLPQRLIDAYVGTPPMSAVMGGDHLDLRTVGQAHLMGPTAVIPLTLRDRDLIVDVHLGLDLAREGERWKVVGLSGLDGALDIIDRAQTERLEIANSLRLQRLAGVIAVGTPAVEHVTHRRSRFAGYRLRVPLTNRSPNGVLAVSLGLRAHGLDDAQAVRLEVEHPIPSGSESAEVWLFPTESAGTRLPSLLAHPERLAVSIRSIVVDSAGHADTLRLIRDYREFHRTTAAQAPPS
jgi:hypothetical protein